MNQNSKVIDIAKILAFFSTALCAFVLEIICQQVLVDGMCKHNLNLYPPAAAELQISIVQYGTLTYSLLAALPSE